MHRASLPSFLLCLAVSLLALVALLGTSACTATLNESPGTTGSCSPDTTVVGCVGDSTGYSCSGVDGPDQGDGSLSCSVGTVGSRGSTLYCCVSVHFASNTCSSASTVVNCGGTAIGFSCEGSGRPDHTDSSLVCSQGAPGSGGSTLYCCAPYMASAGTCSQDTSVHGCGASSIGFSCSGSDRPEQVNPSLSCGQGTASGGATLYCCDTSATPVTPDSTCAVDTNVVCTSPSTGYSCSGGVLPPEGDSSLTCGQGTAGSGGRMAYCCNHGSAVTPDACMQDAAVAGCAANTVGYSCTGAATPPQGDASLTCSTPTAGSSGTTDYCCSNGTPPPPACMADATVTGCPGIATGYSCTGGASPMTGTNLLCDAAPSGTAGAFCCTPN